MKANIDENIDDQATNGVLPLFDGQKNYPALKIHVEYSIVEHVQYNCIEVIGVCLSNGLMAGGAGGAGGGGMGGTGGGTGSRSNSRPGSGGSHTHAIRSCSSLMQFPHAIPSCNFLIPPLFLIPCHICHIYFFWLISSHSPYFI